METNYKSQLRAALNPTTRSTRPSQNPGVLRACSIHLHLQLVARRTQGRLSKYLAGHLLASCPLNQCGIFHQVHEQALITKSCLQSPNYIGIDTRLEPKAAQAAVGLQSENFPSLVFKAPMVDGRAGGRTIVKQARYRERALHSHCQLNFGCQGYSCVLFHVEHWTYGGTIYPNQKGNRSVYPRTNATACSSSSSFWRAKVPMESSPTLEPANPVLAHVSVPVRQLPGSLLTSDPFPRAKSGIYITKYYFRPPLARTSDPSIGATGGRRVGGYYGIQCTVGKAASQETGTMKPVHVNVATVGRQGCSAVALTSQWQQNTTIKALVYSTDMVGNLSIVPRAGGVSSAHSLLDATLRYIVCVSCHKADQKVTLAKVKRIQAYCNWQDWEMDQSTLALMMGTTSLISKYLNYSEISHSSLVGVLTNLPPPRCYSLILAIVVGPTPSPTISLSMLILPHVALQDIQELLPCGREIGYIVLEGRVSGQLDARTPGANANPGTLLDFAAFVHFSSQDSWPGRSARTANSDAVIRELPFHNDQPLLSDCMIGPKDAGQGIEGIEMKNTINRETTDLSHPAEALVPDLGRNEEKAALTMALNAEKDGNPGEHMPAAWSSKSSFKGPISKGSIVGFSTTRLYSGRGTTSFPSFFYTQDWCWYSVDQPQGSVALVANSRSFTQLLSSLMSVSTSSERLNWRITEAAAHDEGQLVSSLSSDRRSMAAASLGIEHILRAADALKEVLIGLASLQGPAKLTWKPKRRPDGLFSRPTLRRACMSILPKCQSLPTPYLYHHWESPVDEVSRSRQQSSYNTLYGYISLHQTWAFSASGTNHQQVNRVSHFSSTSIWGDAEKLGLSTGRLVTPIFPSPNMLPTSRHNHQLTSQHPWLISAVRGLPKPRILQGNRVIDREFQPHYDRAPSRGDPDSLSRPAPAPHVPSAVPVLMCPAASSLSLLSLEHNGKPDSGHAATGWQAAQLSRNEPSFHLLCLVERREALSASNPSPETGDPSSYTDGIYTELSSADDGDIADAACKRCDSKPRLSPRPSERIRLIDAPNDPGILRPPKPSIPGAAYGFRTPTFGWSIDELGTTQRFFVNLLQTSAKDEGGSCGMERKVFSAGAQTRSSAKARP
ncbi:uncharacterized protein CLUP02_03585 [Colletotrichum lupini]|uniref:Uncharacterized protein n=1 Tax=Colletotrichum lupini TaxID=145971 RepID=A0A9Q8WCH7_9PEZI|nr:uncharacterized protein CLUP02_03585 [Colletotrichum lupini]UQC78111.1 hypothetical protein CLUP02_03585 [Colletotrichum lupini]